MEPMVIKLIKTLPLSIFGVSFTNCIPTGLGIGASVVAVGQRYSHIKQTPAALSVSVTCNEALVFLIINYLVSRVSAQTHDFSLHGCLPRI